MKLRAWTLVQEGEPVMIRGLHRYHRPKNIGGISLSGILPGGQSNIGFRLCRSVR
jgi:hypothetical protein